MTAPWKIRTSRYVYPNCCGRTYKDKSGVSQHLTYSAGSNRNVNAIRTIKSLLKSHG